MPDISVVIPTFNRGEMLRKALISALNQVGIDLEIVVSDNCSDDCTQDVMREFSNDRRVRYSRNDRNLGMVGNWKRGVFELASAEWFVLMSDDDYFIDSTYLHRAMAAIQRYQPSFVYGGGYVEDIVAGNSTRLDLPFNGLVSGELVLASRGTVKPQDAILCNMIFRRADAMRLGFLSEPHNLSCDSELYLMLCSERKVYAISEPVCVYVKHGSNIVDKIKRSHRLLAHNLDHLVNPYAYARNLGIPSSAVAAFRSNAKLDDAISSTLLLLWLHNSAWYLECQARLRKAVPELVLEVEASLSYQAKRAVLALGRPYFKSKYPLIDKADSVF